MPTKAIVEAKAIIIPKRVKSIAPTSIVICLPKMIISTDEAIIVRMQTGSPESICILSSKWQKRVPAARKIMEYIPELKCIIAFSSLKKIIATSNDPAEAYEAARKLQAIPKNANPIRLHNRCKITGRPKGYIRQFGLSRIQFREMASAGLIPGVKKASW